MSRTVKPARPSPLFADGPRLYPHPFSVEAITETLERGRRAAISVVAESVYRLRGLRERMDSAESGRTDAAHRGRPDRALSAVRDKAAAWRRYDGERRFLADAYREVVRLPSSADDPAGVMEQARHALGHEVVEADIRLRATRDSLRRSGSLWNDWAAAHPIAWRDFCRERAFLVAAVGALASGGSGAESAEDRSGAAAPMPGACGSRNA